MEPPQANKTSPTKRRWLQFGLRSLLGLVAVAAIALAVIVVPAERQRWAVAALRRLGGSVFYEGDYEAATAISPTSPTWIERVLGPDYARTPAEFGLSGQHSRRRRIAWQSNAC